MCCWQQGIKLLVAATRSTDKSQSNVRSKLLFLGGLIARGDEKAEAALEVRLFMFREEENPKTSQRGGRAGKD